MKTQNQLIEKHLKDGKKITPLGALRLFNCLRLSARIYCLKQAGMKIKMKLVTRKKKVFAEYSL